ncbi:MAG: HutD family protein [Fretibacterium sp.]|nr:HutD family protein [Fretibacterium sp.]
MKFIPKDAFQVSTWSGGRTVQIAISPEGAAYADREFLWRVSSATVELDESDFTALPDYNRWILPLSGSMSLSHNGGPMVSLAPHEAHFFDGADATRCRGRCTDFNLMLRKGRCDGRIFVLTEDTFLSGEGIKILCCFSGSAALSGLSLKEGEAARLEDGENSQLHFTSPGAAAVAVISQL